MAEIDDRVTRLEATFERIFDRLDRIDGRFDRIETQLDTMNQELARISGRIEELPGRWTFLAVILPVSVGLFVGLVGAAWALLQLTAPT